MVITDLYTNNLFMHFLYYSHTLQQLKIKHVTQFHSASMFPQICHDRACTYDYTLQEKVEVVLLHAGGICQGDTSEEFHC